MIRRHALSNRILATIVLAAAAFNCDSTSSQVGQVESMDETRFSHTEFDHFLRRHVDEEGTIDYATVLGDRADLDRYRASLARTSPDSYPEIFETEAERLAYWLNAYNASVIGLVLDHYPMSSVRDLLPPWYLAFLPEGSGFFSLQRFTLGGHLTRLYSLEHSLIRKRFHDSRVHFALNCASASCPRLPVEAFVPERLEEQLKREQDLFLADPRNVRIDEDRRVVFLSSIFEWYESDFVDWPQEEFPDAEASLWTYLDLSLPYENATLLNACSDCRIEFIPYDWTLNDRDRKP